MGIEASRQEAEYLARLRAEVGTVAETAGHRCVALAARTLTDRDAWWAVTRDLDADLRCPTCRGPDGLRQRVAAAAIVARSLAEGDRDGAMSTRLSAQVALAQRMLRAAPTAAALRDLAVGHRTLLEADRFDGSPGLVAFVLARRADECGLVSELIHTLDRSTPPAVLPTP